MIKLGTLKNSYIFYYGTIVLLYVSTIIRITI